MRYCSAALTASLFVLAPITSASAQTFDAPAYGPIRLAQVDDDVDAGLKPRMENVPPTPRVVGPQMLIYLRANRQAAGRRARIEARKAAGISVSRPLVVGRPYFDPLGGVTRAPAYWYPAAVPVLIR
ncbi:hypothetical protein Pan189_39480 [Stratiformator vulcanicus]|uniref:Uncharacterized protein n=2 Tax=Stratiformator vulcanicus TaxID=2527980 RepID=A0A517R6N6_9PLAN|nr:hypothetical protein Pan189_39480 [Stratiformator vulcanicus]